MTRLQAAAPEKREDQQILVSCLSDSQALKGVWAAPPRHKHSSNPQPFLHRVPPAISLPEIHVSALFCSSFRETDTSPVQQSKARKQLASPIAHWHSFPDHLLSKIVKKERKYLPEIPTFFTKV